VVLALLVLACGVPLAWTGATPITHACDDIHRAAEWRHKQIELTAHKLLQLLDKTSA